MAVMDMHEYFHLRCLNTLEAVQNMEALIGDLHRSAQDAHLRELLQQQHDALRDETRNLRMIVDRLGRDRTHPHEEGAAGERWIIIGRTWAGPMGRGMVEEHRVFVEQIPRYIIDVNAAMLAEDATHFNLGNYTGLIVLAKQLGEQDIAGMLQQNIDRETGVRQMLETALAQIVGTLQGQERKAA